MLAPQNRKVLAYVLRHEQETLLVVANLSRFPQPVELDLSAFKDRVPVELFGRTPFPAIGELPFFLTPGPHGFYWFSLEAQLPATAQTGQRAPEARPTLTVSRHWEEILSAQMRPALERAFRPYLRTVSWFAAGAKPIRTVTLQEAVALPLGAARAFLTIWQVELCGSGYGMVCGAADLRRWATKPSACATTNPSGWWPR